MRQDATLLVNGNDCHSNNLLRLAYFTHFFSCSHFLPPFHFLTQSFSRSLPLSLSFELSLPHSIFSLTSTFNFSHTLPLLLSLPPTLIQSIPLSLSFPPLIFHLLQPPNSIHLSLSLNSSLTLFSSRNFSHSHFLT